jgi:hypothetical protein
LHTLDAGTGGDDKKKERWLLFSTVKKEAVFQVVLMGVLTVLFILFVYLAFEPINTKPEPISMGDHMEMYDPLTRAKDLLTLIPQLFTTVLSFGLGFSIQEKKIN